MGMLPSSLHNRSMIPNHRVDTQCQSKSLLKKSYCLFDNHVTTFQICWITQGSDRFSRDLMQSNCTAFL